jgi:hypothetical protein
MIIIAMISDIVGQDVLRITDSIVYMSPNI